MGYAAAGKQGTAAGLAAPLAQGRVCAQQWHLQQLRELFFQLRHHKAADEAAPRPQQFTDATQQGWPFQQLFGERAVGGVVGVEQVQAPPRMGGGNPGQQLQHGIHHQLRQQLAGDIHRSNAGIPEPYQREQLAFFVVVGAGHQRHQGPVHRQRGHHQHIELAAIAAVLAAPARLQLLLQFAEVQGHQAGAGVRS